MRAEKKKREKQKKPEEPYRHDIACMHALRADIGELGIGDGSNKTCIVIEINIYKLNTTVKIHIFTRLITHVR